MPVNMEWVNVYCMMVKIIINDEDAASWCPWNQMVRRLIAFPPTGFMFDVHLKVCFFCRRRDCNSFDSLHWCNVFFLYKTTASVKSYVASTVTIEVMSKINSTLRTCPSPHLIPFLKTVDDNNRGCGKSPLWLFHLFIPPLCSIILPWHCCCSSAEL